MKSIFLSHKQMFENPLPLFRTVGRAAQASDLVLVTIPDDGFTLSENCANYFCRAKTALTDSAATTDPVSVR